MCSVSSGPASPSARRGAPADGYAPPCRREGGEQPHGTWAFLTLLVSSGASGACLKLLERFTRTQSIVSSSAGLVCSHGCYGFDLDHRLGRVERFDLDDRVSRIGLDSCEQSCGNLAWRLSARGSRSSKRRYCLPKRSWDAGGLLDADRRGTWTVVCHKWCARGLLQHAAFGAKLGRIRILGAKSG